MYNFLSFINLAFREMTYFMNMHKQNRGFGRKDILTLRICCLPYFSCIITYEEVNQYFDI